MLPKFWQKEFIFWEGVFSVLLGLGFYFITHNSNLEISLLSLLDGNRSCVYTLMASMAGSLLGFTLTGVAIILTLADNRRLGILTRSRYYPYIYKVYMSAVKALALTTIISLVGLLYDTEASPKPVMVYFTVWAVLLSCLRLFRCIWILENIIRIATQTSTDSISDD